jgi:hypothetical protein
MIKTGCTSIRAETCLAVARILVYSLGFMRLLYWHIVEIFRAYRAKARVEPGV